MKGKTKNNCALVLESVSREKARQHWLTVSCNRKRSKGHAKVLEGLDGEQIGVVSREFGVARKLATSGSYAPT